MMTKEELCQILRQSHTLTVLRFNEEQEDFSFIPFKMELTFTGEEAERISGKSGDAETLATLINTEILATFNTYRYEIAALVKLNRVEVCMDEEAHQHSWFVQRRVSGEEETICDACAAIRRAALAQPRLPDAGIC